MNIPDLARDLLDACRQRGIRLAVAESCTGGLVCAALTAVPGSSDVLECGYVVYSNTAKTKMLGVAKPLIHRHGAVSEEVALAMAFGALAKSGADLAGAITGVAGPGGSELKPEGMVCFAVAIPGKAAVSQTIHYGPVGRDRVRTNAVERALTLLLDAAST